MQIAAAKLENLMRRFKIQIQFTDVVPSLMALFSVEWMILKEVFKVVARVENPLLFICAG